MGILISIFSLIGLIIECFVYIVGVITLGILLTGLIEEAAIRKQERRQGQK